MEVKVKRHGELLREPCVTISGNINSPLVVISYKQAILDCAQRHHKGFNLWLNVAEGNSELCADLYDFIHQINQRAVPITIIVDGQCISEGINLLMAVSARQRWAVEGSVFGMHSRTIYSYELRRVVYEFQSQQPGSLNLPRGVDKRLVEWGYKNQAMWVERIAAETKLNERQVRARLVPNGYWFGAEQAKKDGFVSEIVPR